jgi:hypothetical protein
MGWFGHGLGEEYIEALWTGLPVIYTAGLATLVLSIFVLYYRCSEVLQELDKTFYYL